MSGSNLPTMFMPSPIMLDMGYGMMNLTDDQLYAYGSIGGAYGATVAYAEYSRDE